MIWLVILTFTFYAMLIFWLMIGFKKVENFKETANHYQTSFSVIIPFRNEAENLPLLLKSISEIKYPKELVEFILVDDNSTDDSVKIIQQFVISNKEQEEISAVEKNLEYEILPTTRTTIRIIKNIRNSNSPKKDAITTAISEAKNNWIVTTDADCILPKKWLQSLATFIKENKPKMVVAPVNYKAKNNFLEQFQLLDFMSMQGTTIGGFGMDFPFLCNGANFAYKKDAFIQLNGFEGNNNIASGDDVFLFEKFINADKKSVLYLKSEEAIVTTFPVKTWTDLLNQRTRWAAKTGNFSSLKVKLIGLLVLLTNFMVVYTLLFGSLKLFFIPFVIKIIIDLFLFLPTIQFFKQKKGFYKWYVFASLLYPFFSLFVILKSVFFKYNWKGRRFKK